MGLIARRLGGWEERFDRSAWLNDDDADIEGKMTAAGVRVNERVAFSLPTFWRCVDLITSSIAHSPKDVIVKVAGQSYPEYRNKPDWLTNPSTDPTLTIDDHFAQVVMSLLVNGNFFVHVYPYVGDPRVLTVLNPLRVEVKKGPVYEVKDEAGHIISRLKPMEILHGRWIEMPQELRGLNPVSMLSRTLGAAIASEDFAGRFFGQGAALSFGVEVPGRLDQPKKDELARSLKLKYAGLRGSHAIGVLTDGAKFVPGLAPSPEQAQMLETRKFAVEETCRPFGVPPVMAGVTEPGAMSYASAATQINTLYQRNAVLPFASKIESHYKRILSLPADIGVPADMAFQFNLDWIVRADLLARYQAHKEGVSGGFLTPNEARKFEDLPPYKDGGDGLYMQQQMVPIGTGGQP